ncbi:MAG: anthranilate phosphoribosyltransferase [Acidobacteria bacterium]|nr:anthranilate phosphoribosyltransferase [Acidobacteriota bacterium]
MQIRSTIEQLKNGQHLTRAEARAVLEALLSGSVPDEDIMALLVALREKGEQVDELVGFAEVMRARAGETLRAAGIDLGALRESGPLLDTCGTGGDEKGTFNVSTATALVAAAAGVRVAKHGNRSISSRCGSADVLEALGVRLDIPLGLIPECLEKTGFVFLFAPRLHLAMKHVMKARRALKSKTVFNLLGPLTNPLGASVQLVGVYDRTRTGMMARALQMLGAARAYVVAGHDGLDEITLTAPTQISEVNGGAVTTREVIPEDFGLPQVSLAALAGGDAQANTQLLRELLDGARGALRDVVLANASAALVVAGRAGNFKQGVAQAAEAIDSGAARATLDQLVELTQQAGHERHEA